MKTFQKQKRYFDEKHLWIALIVLFLGALGIIFHANEVFYADFLSTIEGMERIGTHTSRKNNGFAWIHIETSPKKKRVFEGDVDAQKYPLDVALKAAADAGKFSFRAKNGQIAELAQKSETTGHWIIYQNGKIVDSSLANLTIAQGDTYRFVFVQK